MPSFFVSYNKADKAWAEWIAWILEAEDHTAVIQAWDFRPGGNFVLDMDKATKSDKTLVVLSENYLNAAFTQPEWASAFATDPKSEQHKIIPIKVRECNPEGLLGSIIYVDVVGLEREAAQQKILAALPERLKPDSEPPFPRTSQTEPEFPSAAQSRPWNVPYERNAFFTGREAVLQALHQQLNQDEAVALSQTQAISGLGGIGKTQTAVEYVYRHRQDYQAVFWVRAENDLELRTGFVEIARLLNLPQQDAQDSNDTIQAVKQWLEQTPGWLLIFDNADHPELITPFRPRQVQGHILLTSRAQTFDSFGIARPVSLQKMPADEAVAFLFQRAGRETDDPTEAEAAADLATELGFLPLALEQAGAFILRRNLRFSTYLSQYLKKRLTLLERQPPKVGNEQQPERSVRTTWQLNFEAVKTINPASAELLQFSAFVAPDAIPYELLMAGRASLGDLLAETLASTEQEEARFEIAELLEPLSQYSLIRIEPDSDSYTIHRLVQEVVKVEMDGAHRRLWAERAIEAVTSAFPSEKYGNWTDCGLLLPHAKVAIQLATAHQIESESTGLLLARTGYYLNEREQYSEAEPLLKDTLAMRKRLLGDEHPDVATSLNNLAWLYENQGRYNEAEPLYKDALAMSKRLLGDEHLSVAASLTNLARVSYNQGSYKKAQHLYEEALAMNKRLLGEEYIEVAQSLKNLAEFYEQQAQPSEAEPLYKEALAMSKRLLGDEHLEVAFSLNNLAELYKNQERYSEAEPLYQEALAMKRQLLGNEHPQVATSLTSLASFYNDQGRPSEAESLYQEALAMSKQLLGDEHPDVATTLTSLASFYNNQGRPNEAEPFCQEALEISKRLWGDEHREVVFGLNHLAVLYHNQERYSEAKLLCQETLALSKRLWGDEHPDMFTSLSHVAMIYHKQGQVSEATRLYQDALALSKRLWGDAHPNVARILNNLGVLSSNLGRDSEAARLYQDALILLEQHLEAEHPLTKDVRRNLQRLQEKQNRGW